MDNTLECLNKNCINLSKGLFWRICINLSCAEIIMSLYNILFFHLAFSCHPQGDAVRGSWEYSREESRVGEPSPGDGPHWPHLLCLLSSLPVHTGLSLSENQECMGRRLPPGKDKGRQRSSAHCKRRSTHLTTSHVHFTSTGFRSSNTTSVRKSWHKGTYTHPSTSWIYLI